jgi:preprotein translocase subunit YajC
VRIILRNIVMILTPGTKEVNSMMNVAYAMGTNPSAGGQGGLAGMSPQILLIVAMVAIFYFLMIRPQQKRQKEHKSFLENRKRVTRLLLRWFVWYNKGITDDAITIEIAEKVRVKVEKGTVATYQRT